MKIVLVLLLLLGGCTTIDYSVRVREPATDVKYFYVDSPLRTCSLWMGFDFYLACTFFPDAESWEDKNPAHWQRAWIILPKSEKDKPTTLTRHEQAHVDGYNH